MPCGRALAQMLYLINDRDKNKTCLIKRKIRKVSETSVDHMSPTVSRQSSVGLFAWLAWGCGALFYAYQFALRVSPSVMASELMQTLSLDAAGFGLLASFYYYGYAFFQVPAGSLLDVLGARRVLLAFVALCFVGALCFMSPFLWLVYLGRLLIGIGSAASFLACIKIATTYFEPRQMALLTGLSVFLGTMGAVGGGAPLAAGVDLWGWRFVMLILVVMAVGLFVASFIFVKQTPKTQAVTDQPKTSLVQDLKMLLCKKQTWVIGLYGVLMYVPLATFCDLWGPSCLVAMYGVTPTDAAFLVSLIYIGLGVGAPLSSMVLGWFKSYRLCFFASSSLGVTLFLLLLSGWSMPYYALFSLMLAIGLAIAPQVMAFPLITQLNPQRIAGTASGLHNMICMLSGVVMQPLVGNLLGWRLKAGGVPQKEDFMFSLAVVPVALLLAFVCTFFVSSVRHETSA